MAKQDISLGAAPSGAGGDTRRTAFAKCIANFNELYAALTNKLDKSAVVGQVANGDVIETGSNTKGKWVKWADGTMLITFNVWTSPVVGVNAALSIEADLPTSCLGNSESGVWMAGMPTNSNDHYGVISSQLISPTKIQFVIRNGPVAQAFSMRCNIWTRWKSY